MNSIKIEKTRFFKSIRKTLTGGEDGLDIYKIISLLSFEELCRRISYSKENFFMCCLCGAIFPTDITLDKNAIKCSWCDFIESSPFRKDSTFDEKLMYCLVLCKGFRTFKDVIEKIRFAFGENKC